MSHRTAPNTSQRGMALITSLLLLLVVTIMALSMFRSYGLQERIAGNTRDKQRALNAAISAQQFAEFSLQGGNAPTSGQCNAGFVAASNLEVCTNPLASVTATPWTTGVTYTQFTSNPINNVSIAIKSAGGSGDVYAAGTGTLTASASYYAAPAFYIYDLGANKDLTNPGEVYQIDAIGYGGTAATVAVVESVYLLSTNSAKNVDK